ncbi:MAG TPA: DUF2946 family protein [Sphingomicrobium sp.]|jgi:hypothetical protein
MSRLRSAPLVLRSVLALACALLIAVRLLSPMGFMPAFERGSVSIVACPDYGPAPASGHDHGDSKSTHQHCPYAAASGLDAVNVGAALVVALLLFGAALVQGRAFAFLERHKRRERPPSQGPPILA